MEENNTKISEELYSFLKGELASFLKGELERIDTQIKAYKYVGKLEEITRLWELRKDIVNEMTAELHKEEISFLKGELERIDTQVKAYKYDDTKDIVDKIIELFILRKIIAEEIKKIMNALSP